MKIEDAYEGLNEIHENLSNIPRTISKLHEQFLVNSNEESGALLS
jgi:hypothetical protein